MNHYRVMLASHAFAGVMDTSATDRMYDCLPMYHTAGGLVATGALLLKGGSVVIREKFSAREFWDDIVRCDCTLFQYIGELCRYLVNSPPHPKENAHRLRLACGNGLRPDVWPEFKRRFAIPQIIEFYAATEGNVSLFNFEGKEGAVGRLPWFLANRFPTKVVRFDVERQQPVRDAQGFCIECDPDEPGEVIGKILKDASKPGARFEGYATQAETDKKILRDVFEKGDVWFRTGDLMRKDETAISISSTASATPSAGRARTCRPPRSRKRSASSTACSRPTSTASQVPGRDGRAGMAAIVAKGHFDLAAFRAHLARAAARLCAAGVPAHPRRHRGHRHLQAEEGRPGEAGLRSEHHRRSDLFQRSGRQGVRAPRRGALRQHLRRKGAAVSARQPARPTPCRPDGRARLLARRRAEEMVQPRTPPSTPRSRRAFLRAGEAAAAGSLAEWEATPEGALALVIVLDQFPRNMFRGHARAFAADPLARAVADRAIARGFDQRVPDAERRFLLSAVRAFRRPRRPGALPSRCPRAGDADLLKWAELHADIIRRFGRFPHRNAVLGRATTPEEQAFLDRRRLSPAEAKRPFRALCAPARLG